MALSVGGLNAIIFVILAIHVGGLVGYYFIQQKQGGQGDSEGGTKKFVVSDKLQNLFR